MKTIIKNMLAQKTISKIIANQQHRHQRRQIKDLIERL